MAKEVEVLKGKGRAVYTEEEKRRIVEESYTSTRSLTQYAKSLGLSCATLCVWRKKLGEGAKTQTQASSTLPAPLHFHAPKEYGNSVETLESLLSQNESLKHEVLTLRERLFGLEAFLGRKVFSFEGAQREGGRRNSVPPSHDARA